MKKMASALLFLSGMCLVSVLGCAGSNPVFRPQAPALAGNTMLYLYRPEASTPGIAKPLRLSYPEVFVDGQPIGIIAYNRYMPIELKPGRHRMRLTGLTENAKDWEARDIEQDVTVEAGRNNYLRFRVEYNLREMSLGRPKSQYIILLTPVSERDAQYEIRNTQRM